MAALVRGSFEGRVPNRNAEHRARIPRDVDESAPWTAEVGAQSLRRPGGRDRPACTCLGEARRRRRATGARAEDDAQSLDHGAPLQDAASAKADEAAGLAEDQVVEDLDPEELAGRGETARQGDVLGGGLGVAARMVVSEQERGAAGEDGGLEDFAGLCCQAGYVA